MLKEIKYLIFVVIIILFFFLLENIIFQMKILKILTDLTKILMKKLKFIPKIYLLLKNDTENIIEYVKQTDKKKKKKFNFWKLLEND